MRDFDAKLLRLKQATGLTADQDVAALLGMTKAAFSDRKKRDAFPEEKLYAIAAQKPDAKLEVRYILTGRYEDHERLNTKLLALKAATEKASRLGLAEPYNSAVQEILFFVELEDAQGIRDTFRRWIERKGPDDLVAPERKSG